MPAEAVWPLYLGLRSLCPHSLLSSLEVKAEPASSGGSTEEFVSGQRRRQHPHRDEGVVLAQPLQLMPVVLPAVATVA